MLHIEPIDHHDPQVAARIHAVLVLAHAHEGRLLGSKAERRLERTVADIQAATAFYFGALRDGELLGAISLGPDDEPGQLRISSLVVHPEHHRQGIGAALMQEVLRRSVGMPLAVAATARNGPALALYGKFGFVAYRRGSLGPEAIEMLKLRRVQAPVEGLPSS
jgi:ribosomal protein S18 acetylase RimI-like enzyme